MPRLSRLADPVLADGERHGAEGPDRSHPHDDRHDAEEDVRQLLDEAQHERALFLEGRERHPEEDRKEQHLQDVAARERVGHVLGDDVEQKVGGAEGVPGGGVVGDGAGVERRRVDVHPGARLHELADQQAEGEREGGQDLEVDDPLEADPPHPLQIAHLGDARHHRREDDRGDEHLDELDEPVAERLHRRAERRVEKPEEGPEGDRHQDLKIKAAQKPFHGAVSRG